jgi:hypothetical protein
VWRILQGGDVGRHPGHPMWEAGMAGTCPRRPHSAVVLNKTTPLIDKTALFIELLQLLRVIRVKNKRDIAFIKIS